MIIECVMMTAWACQLAKMRVEYALVRIGPTKIQKVYVLGEDYWKRTPYTAETQTAYTVPTRGVTNLRAEYVLSHNTSNERLERTLRHENGHLLCGCDDEARADRAGGVR